MATGHEDTTLHKALVDIRDSVESLNDSLSLRHVADLSGFKNVLDSKLLARTSPDYPLVVSIAGGGSTGKSTLFNAMTGGANSIAKARAGLTRRTLAAIHQDVLRREGFLENLFSPFSEIPTPLKSQTELTEPGSPRYIECSAISPSIVLLDTPDFDTGDSARLFNRDIAKPVLEASDVIIYTFTGTTYNNRANTQFLGSVLRDLGCRKVALVYRCYSSLPEEEVREHAEVVLENIYGKDSTQWCLGIYRVDEENLVAEGKKPAVIRPLSGGLPLYDVLARLSPQDVRSDFIKEALRGVREVAGKVHGASESARLELSLYSTATKIATSWAAADAVQSFPQAALLDRFADIWLDSKSIFLSAPVKFTNWLKAKLKPGTRRTDAIAVADGVFKKDILEAANKLRNQLAAEGFAVKTSLNDQAGKTAAAEVARLENLGVTSPELFAIDKTDGGVNLRVAKPSRLAAPKIDSWETRIGEIDADASGVMEVSEQFDARLRKIAVDFREGMGFKDKVRESITGALPAITAVAAVTWVIGTGGTGAAGGGIIAHIGGMFGMNDLIALVALPVIPGLDKLNRATLAKLITPIMGAWLDEKTTSVRSILENRITKPSLDAASETIAKIEPHILALEAAIQALPENRDGKGNPK